MSPNDTSKPFPTNEGNPFASLQDLSAMSESLPESAQATAPATAPARKQTTKELFAAMQARMAAIEAKDAAHAAQKAQQAAPEGGAVPADTPKRPRSPSLEKSQKRRRDAMDVDQPATDKAEIVELTPIQRIAKINLKSLDFPTNTRFKCAMSVDNQHIVGGLRMVKGYSISFLIDEGRYGLPHIRLLFKSNKLDMLNRDLSTEELDRQEFSICYYPGVESIYGNETMITAFYSRYLLGPAIGANNDMDKHMLESATSDNDREKLIKICLKIRKHEVQGDCDARIWLGGLGTPVATTIANLFGGEGYNMTLWTLRTGGLLKALDSFHLAFQARLPVLHQYYQPDLSALVLDLDKTPTIDKIGNGMYIIHPKVLDEEGRPVKDEQNRPVFDTTANPIGYHSLPFIKDWAHAEHFMIYNGLNVIREYHFQCGQHVNQIFVDMKVFIKKMPGFRIGTEALRANREQCNSKRREITSLFFVFFRTPSKEGVKETAPQEGTRVSIIFHMHAESEQGQRLWRGIVLRRDPEELKSTGCDFCVLASKPSNTPCLPAHDDLIFLPDSKLQDAGLKVSLSHKPALRELEAVKALCASEDPQIRNLRDLLINKADPDRRYPTVDITGGPTNDEKLKALFDDRITAIPGLSNEQKRAFKALQNIPMGIHVVEGPPGTAKTTMIANIVWPCVEVGHRVCCFTTTYTSADHLTNAIAETCPPQLEDKLVIRMNIAAVEDLLIKRSSQFDHETPNDEQLQQLPKHQQFNEPEDNDRNVVMGVEHITQAVIDNDALLEQIFDELSGQKTHEEAFRLLQEKAYQRGKLNVPLATTLAYRIWEMEMQDHITATNEYNSAYEARTKGLDPTAMADVASSIPSINDRDQSGPFKKYREFFINQDGRIFGASKRMFKQLTKEMVIRVMGKVSILIVIANNAGSELAELGFKPTLLICEEGGRANIANFSVPLTVFTGWQACLVLGDMKQLQPPVFSSRSNEVSQNGKLSILELLGHKGFPSHKLEIQYRMDPDIAQFPNLRFYNGTLKNGDNTWQPNPTKDILRRVSKDVLKIRASTFWMVDVHNGVSHHEAGGSSLQNHANADAIHEHVSRLLDQGIQASQITILVYYRAQSKILAQRLRRVTADGKFERMYSSITTVDAFHGKESDIIILDMVVVGRTDWIGNSQGPETDDVDETGEEEANAEYLDIGESRVFAKYTEYAKNRHRLNVACTRSKMGLIVFCHTESMLATSRPRKKEHGIRFVKSDLAALAKNALDRGVVVKFP